MTDKDIELDPTITLIPVNDEDKLKFFCLMCRVALLTEEVCYICHPLCTRSLLAGRSLYLVFRQFMISI